jgi:hypothetical protein
MAKREASKNTRPAIPMATSGNTFRTVVTICIRPATRSPAKLTAVKTQTVATANAAASTGVRTMVGKNGSRYPTKATARAALVLQTEIR